MFGEKEDESREFVDDEELTDPESRVAAAVARDLSNKESAAELNPSLRTIEGYISRILDKKTRITVSSSRSMLRAHVGEAG
jgi:DNA-binding NarL/FixJ family response regulator